MNEINSSKRISINIISSVFQVLSVGVVYLFLYKYLLNVLGIKQLGVWSIILATTSIANLANFGITSGLVKFVADYNAQGRKEDISKLIFTAFLSIVVFFIMVIIVIYCASYFFLSYIVEPAYLGIAISVLPYSLLCLFLNSISGIFTSTLEGFQKNYIRNFLMIFSTFILLISAYYLVPKYHLKGMAFAQVLQALIVLLGSYVSLKRSFDIEIFNRWNWERKIFKQLFNFGLKFQIISIFLMLNEPITKSLLSKFGGLSTLGYYEMASRLVNQIRALIVNANQVMIPVVAHTSNTDKSQVNELYKSTMSITIFVNIILISALLAFIPIISMLWIGSVQTVFVFSMLVLSISMFINILNGPAYFSCIGEGKINDLLISHVVMSLLNLILGIILGYFVSGYFVIIAWGFSLIIGSLYLVYSYQRKNKISYDFIYTKYNIRLLLTSFTLSVTFLLIFQSMLKYFSVIIIIVLFSIVLLSSFIYFLKTNKLLSEFFKNK